MTTSSCCPFFGSDTMTVTMGNDASATVLTTATTGMAGMAGDYAATTGQFCCLHLAIVVNVRAIVMAVAVVDVGHRQHRPLSWPFMLLTYVGQCRGRQLSQPVQGVSHSQWHKTR